MKKTGLNVVHCLLVLLLNYEYNATMYQNIFTDKNSVQDTLNLEMAVCVFKDNNGPLFLRLLSFPCCKVTPKSGNAGSSTLLAAASFVKA